MRNVPPTNIRSWEAGRREYDGNSIFIFEAAGRIIAHLGRLHHRLTPDHVKEIGPYRRGALAPVDGSTTLSASRACSGDIATLRAPSPFPCTFSDLRRWRDSRILRESSKFPTPVSNSVEIGRSEPAAETDDPRARRR